MKKLRIGFMGTPDFAKTALQALIDSDHDVVCVYSQPPRPKGRGHKTIPSPVHALADMHNIPVFTPLNFKSDDDRQAFAAHDLDLAIVAAYGLILPQAVLDAPRFGCINIHGSLLPRWRGAAPIQRAIWDGDTQSGICIMQMEAGLDTGPVIMEEACPITDTTTAPQLHDTLAAIGARMAVQCANRFADAQAPLPTTAQDDSLSTYASMLSKEDGRIDWSQHATQIDRQIRALNPWPATWCERGADRFKILSATLSADQTDQAAGTLLNKHGDVACAQGSILRLGMVQPAGKKAMDVASALNGGYLSVGEVIA